MESPRIVRVDTGGGEGDANGLRWVRMEWAHGAAEHFLSGWLCSQLTVHIPVLVTISILLILKLRLQK